MALSQNQEIRTRGFKTVKIIKELGEGGQGIVYLVDYGGKPMALKWFKKGVWRKPDAVYENLKHNIDKGSPTDGSTEELFLWPKDITEWHEDSFGYVMDLRPPEYIELTEYLLAKGDGGFPSLKAVVEVCIKIVSAFRLLHNAGYSYQDMNSGNFFMNPKSGKVLICDNDNVAPNGTNMGILGTPRFMAPELVSDLSGGTRPSTHTDEFSLAVVLFFLICRDHPLEGKRSVVPCLTSAIEKKLYGDDPIFVFDPDDDSNRPIKGIHNNVLLIWDCLPKYIKDAFRSSFSKEAIKNPNKRLKELDWLNVLVRFQSDIVRCPACKKELFIIDSAPTNCDVCGKLYTFKNSLELSEYSVPVARGTRIYKCQLGVCNAQDALVPIATVIAKNDDPNVLGLMNMTRDTLAGTSPNGRVNPIIPGQVIPIIPGISIKVSDNKIKII